jgi:hypothetical protein
MGVEYEQSTHSGSHLQPAKAGLGLCQLRIHELSSIVSELDELSFERKSNRRLRESLKVTLRQDLITKFLLGLERVKLTLLLVDQQHFR